MKRIIIRVQWSKADEGWYVKLTSAPSGWLWYHLKRGAVKRAVNEARSIAANGGLSQVVSHRRDGVIQWERTYGKDPRRSKG